jgi:hypothetical protein
VRLAEGNQSAPVRGKTVNEGEGKHGHPPRFVFDGGPVSLTLRSIEFINTLTSKGNKVRKIELGTSAFGLLQNEATLTSGKTVRIVSLWGIPVEINPALPSGRVLFTYEGRIVGILDSVALPEA